MTEEHRLSDADLDFLIEETRRREDTLDAAIEAVTRKSYYAFTLATTVLAFYLGSVKDELDSEKLINWPIMVGAAGIVFYVVGVVLFWQGHSARSYERVPDPAKLVDAHIHPRQQLRLKVNMQRAETLVDNLNTQDSLADTVNSQHDMLALQLLVQVLSWLLFYL